MKKPIVLFVYKRPAHTAKVLEAILKVKPEKLYVVADGPKSEKDKIACEQVLETVRTYLSETDVQLKQNVSPSNMGGPKRIPSGLDWVFSMEEDAIILEDDCVPSTSFFYFCEELLDRYRDDDRIGVISGNNFHNTRLKKNSYYFSIFNHCWGWATWKRAWRYFDINLRCWPEYKESNYIQGYFSEKLFFNGWCHNFEKIYTKEKIHWDYAWTFACWSQNLLSIIPEKNLVTNIGFGLDASNTTSYDDRIADRNANELNFPLVHPEMMCRNFEADMYVQKNIFGSKKLYERIFSKVGRICSKFLHRS